MPLRHVVCAVLMAGAAPVVSAQSIGVSALASTLGMGGELSLRASEGFGFRAGYLLFSLTHQDLVEGIRYDVTPRLRNAQFGADLHPFGGALRLSGGLVHARSRAVGEAVLDGPVDVGGATYQPADVGRLEGVLEYQRDWMPWAGLGVVGGGRVAVSFDVGVVFSGHPRVRLTSSGGTLSGAERDLLDQHVAAEEAELQGAITREKLARYFPIVSFGLRVRL